MHEEPWSHFNCRIYRDRKRMLEDRATELGVTASEIVRGLIDGYLDHRLIDESISLTQLQQEKTNEIQRHEIELRKIEAKQQAIQQIVETRQKDANQRIKLEELAQKTKVRKWFSVRQTKWKRLDRIALVKSFEVEFNEKLTWDHIQELKEMIGGEMIE